VVIGEISIKLTELKMSNPYDLVEYEYVKERNILYIKWDDNNKELDDVMSEDALMRDSGLYYNHSWVDIVKHIVNWEQGNVIYIRSCYVYRGKFHISIKNYHSDSDAYEQIDSNGFLRLRKYNEKLGYYSGLEIVNCLYNTNNK